MSSTPLPPPRLRRRNILTDDWRRWVLPGVVRGGVAVGFAGVPAIDARFGDATFVMVCCVLAACVSAAIGLEWYSGRGEVRRELVVDVITLLSLVPIVTVAGELLVADGRFGGRTSNVLAMLGLTLVVMLMLTIVARVSPTSTARSGAMSLLPAALTVAAVVGGPRLYATAQVWQGVSLAWMVAGIVTMSAIIVGPRSRLIFAIFMLILFAIGTMIISSAQSGPNINTDAASLGIVAVGLTIGIVVFESLTKHRSEEPTANQRWSEYQ